MLRRFYCKAAIVAAALAVSPAQAQDAVEQNSPVGYDWSGFHAGAHAGFASADFGGVVDLSSTSRPVDSVVTDPDGLIGGFQAGFDWQQNQWVIGVEADVTFGDLSESIAATGPDSGAIGGLVDIQSASVDYLASARVRGGYAFGEYLLYATAGLALASADFTFFDDEANTSGSLDFNDAGFVAGLGAEGAINQSPLTWRVEGLYYHFGDSKSAATLTPDNDPGDFVEFNDVFAVRVGLSYRFGATGM